MVKTRIYFFYGFLIIGMMLIFGRLFELQIIRGGQNRAMADGNRIRKILIPAPRGIIFDRNGRQLVRNIPLYRLRMVEENGREKWQEISREKAIELETKNETENLRMDIGRQYIYGKSLAHVLGYLGEANEDEVRSGRRRNGDLVGRTGIEEQYDEVLRGKDGGRLIEVDAHGVQLREISRLEPQPGKDIRLTIDAELSYIAYEAMEEKPGAVVATTPSTGEIIIMVSSPAFDPEVLTPFLNDPFKPFFNRAVSGVYPPGSTFKIITAIAGLELGKIDRTTMIEDTGRIWVGRFSYANWYFTQYGRTEGKLNLVRAIKRSTDTFFYKVGEWVGPEDLALWARRLRLGEKTGIDLPNEATGLVPDPRWKEEKTGERWYLGNTYHLAIGQGDILATPLQVNLFTSAVAAGRLCQPHLVRMENSAGACEDLAIKKESFELVREGMVEACRPGGTAFPFFDFTPVVACKTGTAEFGDEKKRTHAWFTAFAPADQPALALTVLAEGGGEGSRVAAPIAKKIFEKWKADQPADRP